MDSGLTAKALYRCGLWSHHALRLNCQKNQQQQKYFPPPKENNAQSEGKHGNRNRNTKEIRFNSAHTNFKLPKTDIEGNRPEASTTNKCTGDAAFPHIRFLSSYSCTQNESKRYAWPLPPHPHSHPHLPSQLIAEMDSLVPCIENASDIWSKRAGKIVEHEREHLRRLSPTKKWWRKRQMKQTIIRIRNALAAVQLLFVVSSLFRLVHLEICIIEMQSLLYTTIRTPWPMHTNAFRRHTKQTKQAA